MFQTHEDETLKPIGYWFISLNDAERNYISQQRECLSVLRELETFRPYLQYDKSTIFFDHHSLN